MDVRAYKLKMTFQVSGLCTEINWANAGRSDTHHYRDKNLQELPAFSYSAERMTILCSGGFHVWALGWRLEVGVMLAAVYLVP